MLKEEEANAKLNWRQARPPKAAIPKTETADSDLQAGAALLAGTNLHRHVCCNGHNAFMHTNACQVSTCNVLACCDHICTPKDVLDLAGPKIDAMESLEAAVRPPAQRNKRSKVRQ